MFLINCLIEFAVEYCWKKITSLHFPKYIARQHFTGEVCRQYFRMWYIKNYKIRLTFHGVI